LSEPGAAPGPLADVGPWTTPDHFQRYLSEKEHEEEWEEEVRD